MAPASTKNPQIRPNSWPDVLCCPECNKAFSKECLPLNLACGHPLCFICAQQPETSCPMDEVKISKEARNFPVNTSLLALLGIRSDSSIEKRSLRSKFSHNSKEHSIYSEIEELLICLAHNSFQLVESERGATMFSDCISRTIQRKLMSFLCVQLFLAEGRVCALRILRSMAERITTEVILAIQNTIHISSSLWSAVRSRGCQFLGPAMQEDALRLILLALSKGEMIARKTLVMYVVQTLSEDYPHVSKTCIGHVVQLLYRASCFNVIKRDNDSSLMQLKDEFRQYESLRLEHDAQIIQIAIEANLRISPEQWSSLLYGDLSHRSEMQSILDKLWAASSSQLFSNAILELKNCVAGHVSNGVNIEEMIDHLTSLDVEESETVSGAQLLDALTHLKVILDVYVKFFKSRKINGGNYIKKGDTGRSCFPGQRLYKTRLCREVALGKLCLQGDRCNYAHGQGEVRNASMPMNNGMAVLNDLCQELPMMIAQPPVANIPPAAMGNGFINLVPFQGGPKVLGQQDSMMALGAPILAHQSVNQQMPPQPASMFMMPPPPLQMLTNHNPQVPPPIPGRYPVEAGMFTAQPSHLLFQHVWNHPVADTLYMDENVEKRSLNGNFFYPPEIFENSIGCGSSRPSEETANWGESSEEEQLRMRRNEIISRLVQMRPSSRVVDEGALEEDLESHVSFTVANSVLSDPHFTLYDDYNKDSGMNSGTSNLIDLPPLPIGHTPLNQFPNPHTCSISQMSLSLLNTMTYSIARDSSKPNLCSTIRTVCPNSYGEVSAQPATVQADCSVMVQTEAIDQPLVMSSLQQQNLSPQASYEMLDPYILTDQLPTTIRPLHLTPADPQGAQDFVGATLDKICDVKERIIDVEKHTGMSSAVEKEQLKVELRIASRQISSLDEYTKESCLLKELKAVDEKIENLNINS